MIALTPVSPDVSSQVAAYGYDSTQQVLRVTCRNGKTYDYKGVTAEKIEQLAGAQSIGKFLHAEVKGKHDFELVLTEADEDGPITTTDGATVDLRAAWPLPAGA